jgi:uncharacterized protein
MDKIKVAVLVENHEYDVIGLQTMLNSFGDCECYVQPVDLFVKDKHNQNTYDTVLWYNMNIPIPEAGSALREYVDNTLGETGQGIVLMHHALLCFKRWDVYTAVSGVSVRLEDGLFSYHQNTTVKVHIEDPAHPITQGLNDYTLIDETYTIGEPDQPGNHLLLSCECPIGIKNIGWTRMYKNSRVFVTASGHDNQVYGDPNFRRLLHNALRWSAKSI